MQYLRMRLTGSHLTIQGAAAQTVLRLLLAWTTSEGECTADQLLHAMPHILCRARMANCQGLQRQQLRRTVTVLPCCRLAA
jgi:hypothetical protein